MMTVAIKPPAHEKLNNSVDLVSKLEFPIEFSFEFLPQYFFTPVECNELAEIGTVFFSWLIDHKWNTDLCDPELRNISLL